MPTFFHREVPSSPHLPSHSIPPGCSGDESSGRPSFWLTTHPPEGSNLGCFADRLRKQVVACLPEESKWAGYLQRAWQRALPSEAVWVMALPSQSSLPRGFATERTTEKLFAGARRLFQKSLISWAPKYVTLRWETRGCFFFFVWAFFFFFFFFPESLQSTHFRAHSQYACHKNLNRVIINRRRPPSSHTSYFPYTYRALIPML